MIYLTHRSIRILSMENMIKDDAKNKIEYGSDNMKPSERKTGGFFSEKMI